MKRDSKINSRESAAVATIKAICDLMQDTLGEDMVAIMSKPSKLSVYCKGMIEVYLKSDLDRAAANKREKAQPVECYAFYCADNHSGKLDSVAIYGGNAYAKCGVLRRRGTLFGYRVAHATVEVGRRPFVDVKLGA